MYKKILVPLDGSELAEKALDHAEKLAETFDAEVILLQVVAFMPIYGAPELVVPFVVDEKQQEAAEKYLTHLAEGLSISQKKAE
jgi:nucleotide-binding universal stress UspA family protein